MSESTATDPSKLEQAKLAQGYNLWVNMLTTVLSSPVAAEIYKADPNGFLSKATAMAYGIAGAIAEEGLRVEEEMGKLKSTRTVSTSGPKLVI